MRKTIMVISLFFMVLNMYKDKNDKMGKNKIKFTEEFLGKWNEEKQDIIGFCNTKKRIYVTSTLSEKYKAENMIDGSIKTCWATKVNGGIGEQFFIIASFGSFTLPKIEGIDIYNGYCKSKKLYYRNNRIKKLRIDIYRIIEYPIETDKGLRWYTKKNDINLIKTQKVYLIDKYRYENKVYLKIDLDKDFNKILDKKGITPVYYFLFTIEDIYKGSKYNDLCVSEIKFIYK